MFLPKSVSATATGISFPVLNHAYLIALDTHPDFVMTRTDALKPSELRFKRFKLEKKILSLIKDRNEVSRS